jgi:hypothetical protein
MQAIFMQVGNAMTGSPVGTTLGLFHSPKRFFQPPACGEKAISWLRLALSPLENPFRRRALSVCRGDTRL